MTHKFQLLGELKILRENSVQVLSLKTLKAACYLRRLSKLSRVFKFYKLLSPEVQELKTFNDGRIKMTRAISIN